MKNSKEKSTMMAVSLLSLLLIIVVYLFVYKSYNDKTNELKTSNATLQARVDELKVYYDDRETYEKGIETFKQDISTKLSVFPGDSREEDALDLAITPWKNNVLVDYQQIAIGEPEEVSTIDEDTVKNAAIEGYENAITFNRRISTFTNYTTYENLKDIVKLFNDKGDRLVISTISYMRDETNGLLNGSIETSFYYVTGINAPYTKPEFSEYLTGLTNIFAVSPAAKSENGLNFINNGQIVDVTNGASETVTPEADGTATVNE